MILPPLPLLTVDVICQRKSTAPVFKLLRMRWKALSSLSVGWALLPSHQHVKNFQRSLADRSWACHGEQEQQLLPHRGGPARTLRLLPQPHFGDWWTDSDVAFFQMDASQTGLENWERVVMTPRAAVKMTAEPLRYNGALRDESRRQDASGKPRTAAEWEPKHKNTRTPGGEAGAVRARAAATQRHEEQPVIQSWSWQTIKLTQHGKQNLISCLINLVILLH